MTTEGTYVEGEAELTRTLHALAEDLSDLSEPTDQAAALLLATANPKTPRRSGRLAASGRVDAASHGSQPEAAVVYDEVYAGVIHNGWPAHNIEAQPWLADTAANETTALTDVFTHYVSDAVHRVRGA